jgi:hypothetical protein
MADAKAPLAGLSQARTDREFADQAKALLAAIK